MTTSDPDPLPRQRSQAQVEASRNNGARSKGPATPEGKAASCHNAAKHGLRAQGFALLPDEDADAFAALLDRLVAEHDPQGAVEEALVEGLALALWRMRRVEALEVEALTEARERRPSTVYAGGYNPHSPALWAPERMNTILRYRAGLERGLHRTLKALAERRAARAAEENDTNEPESKASAAAPSDAPRAEQAARTNPSRPFHPGRHPAKAGRKPKAKKRKKKAARQRTRSVHSLPAYPLPTRSVSPGGSQESHRAGQ